MYPQTWTAASIKSHRSDLEQRIHALIPLKDSVLKEAHASGLGFRTHAALMAALKLTPALPAQVFNTSEFVRRITELANDVSAEVVTEILEYVQLDFSAVKRSEQRQRTDRYSDIAYDVSVTVTLGKDTKATLDGEIKFHLPEFGQGAGVEPYRIDSAHDMRAVTDYRKTHNGTGGTTLAATLVNGHWHGGFYVYAPNHQANDTQCIKSLKAALSRAILPQLPTRVRCFIFKPDNYQTGAWRIEIRLPSEVKQLLNGSPFQFELPTLPKRQFVIAPEFRADLKIGRFIDGIFKADIYSNGIAEAENPTTLPKIKHALLLHVNEQLLSAGVLREI